MESTLGDAPRGRLGLARRRRLGVERGSRRRARRHRPHESSGRPLAPGHRRGWTPALRNPPDAPRATGPKSGWHGTPRRARRPARGHPLLLHRGHRTRGAGDKFVRHPGRCGSRREHRFGAFHVHSIEPREHRRGRVRAIHRTANDPAAGRATRSRHLGKFSHLAGSLRPPRTRLRRQRSGRLRSAGVVVPATGQAGRPAGEARYGRRAARV